MVGIRYAPGAPYVIATRGAVVLIDADIAPDLLTRIWREVDDGRGLAAVLEALSGAFGTSLTAIPPFVVAVAEEGGVRIAVRGDILLTATGSAGTENITGTGVTTWSERLVAATRTAIRLGSSGPQPEEQAFLPLRDGVVRASALVIDWTDTSSAAPSGVVPPAMPDLHSAGVVPVAARTSAAESAETGDSALSADPALLRPVGAAEGPAAAPAPAGPWSQFAAPDAAPNPAPAARRESAEDVPRAESSDPSELPASGHAAEPAGIIDSAMVLTAGAADTWIPQDATLAPEPEQASAPADLDDVPSATTGYDHLWGATVVRSVEDAAVRASDEDEDAASGVAADPAADAAGDHDGETVSVAQARALRAAAGAADDVFVREEPATDSVPPLAPPRPAAPGQLRLSTGQVVVLDRTVVIGRRPRSTRVTGTDLPHLIAVDSPEQDISRSHIEVRVEGDSILATDLQTTNGTTLLRPGADPVRLHPGERTVVVAGDVLDLGDGVTVTLEEIA
jgi:hypothetical protein